MNRIEKDINVTHYDIPERISYVQATNAIPLVFHIKDYDIPSGSTARVYVKRPDGTAEYDTASLSGNTVTVNVKKTMFAVVGNSRLQIRIANGDEVLVTFETIVEVRKNHAAGGVKSENATDIFDEALKDLDEATKVAAVKAGEAENSAVAAGKSETAAKASETKSKASEQNALQSATDAEGYKNTAAQKASEAAASQAAAANSEQTAAQKATAASNSAVNAANSASNAASSATTATQKASAASASASNADTYAKKSQSYAVGGTGTRPGEDTDNAEYYYNQAKHISQGLNGIINMGNTTFSQLASVDKVVNYMYNVTDAFTSDSTFNDGGGKSYGAGNNVVWTGEGKWDVLAASAVQGIKGDAETTYHQGNVNLTPANIGALSLLNGGVVNGKTFFNYGTGVRTISNGGGTAGFFNVCRLKITGTYINQYIIFRAVQRGNYGDIYVGFSGMNTTDPTLNHLFVSGGISAYIHKAATSTWDLYVRKTEAYDNMEIYQLCKGLYSNNILLTWIDETVTTLPSGYLNAERLPWYGRAENADTVDDKHASDFLLKAGGSMTGKLQAYGGIALNDTTKAAPLECILGIKTFADGGDMVWQNANEVKVGKSYELEPSMFTYQVPADQSTGWYKVATLKVVGQYGDAELFGLIYTMSDSVSLLDYMWFCARLKQQGAMGTTPIVKLNALLHYGIDLDDLRAYITQNTASLTQVEIWCRIRVRYRAHANVCISKAGSLPNSVVLSTDRALYASPPTGDYISAVLNASVGNANTLGGYGIASSSNAFGGIPLISHDGVMEIGKYVDFHEGDNEGKDYSVRLISNNNVLKIDGGGNAGEIVTRPATAGLSIEDYVNSFVFTDVSIVGDNILVQVLNFGNRDIRFKASHVELMIYDGSTFSNLVIADPQRIIVTKMTKNKYISGFNKENSAMYTINDYSIDYYFNN